MNTSNNRLLYNDPITEGWTKKDWALNLIPLGGIASAAYEIGSACVSARDRTTKISQDFFKSPIRTTLKKIAQCLWVPIVFCGVLKLVSLIVKACWHRYFPAVIDPQAKDPCEITPCDVATHIFSYLNLHELGVIRRVSKRWSEFGNTPFLWQSVIYREIAFSSKNWAQWDADIVKDVDMRKEILSLPRNIAEELRRSAFPGKSIRETHVLVRMPKGLTITKLGELAKKYFPNNAEGYAFIWTEIVMELGDKPADESVWLLMTRNVLPGSKKKNYSQQKNIVAEFAKTTQVPYQVPTTLEAVTCILAEYSRSEKRLFGDRTTYTRCQKNNEDFHIMVGNFAVGDFASNGLKVIIDNFAHDYIGVAALRKF